jgi:hypothetical protein
MEVETPKLTQDFATLLWKTSSKVFLDNQNTFLRKFTSNIFSNNQIIINIEKALSSGTPIGEKSAMGFNTLVTVAGGKKYVVKTMILCPNDIDSESVFKRTLCREAKMGDIIFRVPNSYERKQILLTPNYFSESLIGILLSSSTIAKHTPSFPKIYGFQYDEKNPNKKIYTVMEPLKPVLPLLTDEANLLYFVFQLSAALNTAQKLGRYTHWDLHSGNVLSRPKDVGIVRVYELNNGKYLYTQFDYDTIIIDFGMNRMETTEEIIVPKINFPAPELCKDLTIDQLREVARQQNVPNYLNMTKDELCIFFGVKFHDNKGLPDAFNAYEFNPYYDLFTILYFTMFIDGKLPIAGSVELEIIRNRLMSGFLGIKNDENTIAKHIDSILMNYWRPDPNAFGTYTKGGISPMIPENFMSVIAGIIEKITKRNYDDFDTYNKHQLSQLLYNQKILVLDNLINLDGQSNIKSTVIHSLVPKKESMNTIYYQTRLLDTAKMDYIKIDTRHEIINNVSQYLHIATIDQKEGIKGGLKFRLDCCRVGIRNFFRTDKIISGVAINAGFFQIRSDFTPVGYYKTADMLSKNPIPGMYESYYGMVGTASNGLLGLRRNVSETAAASFTNVVTIGPVLLWDNEIVMTEQILDEIDNGIAKFHCTPPPQNENANAKYFKSTTGIEVPNCNTIFPGELSHASNPNPRSAIAMNDKTGMVYFVYVEGRNQRGAGMHLLELAHLCKNIGATHAINLDGGGSSQLVWRSPGETIIGQTNPDHNFEYPVGNIISFVKEK